MKQFEITILQLGKITQFTILANNMNDAKKVAESKIDLGNNDYSVHVKELK